MLRERCWLGVCVCALVLCYLDKKKDVPQQNAKAHGPNSALKPGILLFFKFQKHFFLLHLEGQKSEMTWPDEPSPPYAAHGPETCLLFFFFFFYLEGPPSY